MISAIFIVFVLRVAQCGLVSISFGAKLDCSLEQTIISPGVNITVAPRDCIAMTALLALNQWETSFNTTIVSYKDNNGATVNLNYTIGIEASVQNTTVEIPVEFVRTVYNVYEAYDPGEGCAIGIRVGPCYSPFHRPPITDRGDENFVLCCINKDGGTRRRKTGAYCLRYDYQQSYDQYKFAVTTPVLISQAIVKIYMKGQVRQFQLSSFIRRATTKGFGQVDVEFAATNRDYLSELSYMYSFFRDTRPGMTRVAETQRWYYVNNAIREATKLNLSPAEFRGTASCTQEANEVTRTHTSPSNQQFVAQNTRGII